MTTASQQFPFVFPSPALPHPQSGIQQTHLALPCLAWSQLTVASLNSLLKSNSHPSRLICVFLPISGKMTGVTHMGPSPGDEGDKPH